MAKMLVPTAATLMVIKVVAATIYTVGDATRWTLPSSPDFYSSWAAAHSFFVGDILVFEYGAPHTVAKVSQEGYDQCVAGDAVVHNVGPTEVTLDIAGSFYFMCTVPGHCSSGLKLAINVTSSAAASPTPSSSPDRADTQATTALASDTALSEYTVVGSSPHITYTSTLFSVSFVALVMVFLD